MKGVLHNGMSLFQDLKLKRRKVDSRCSSDGESIGTSDSTASLSPDAQLQNGEGSPKNKERCTTPDELVRSSSAGSPSSGKLGKSIGIPNGQASSAPTTNGYSSHSSLMYMVKGDRKDQIQLSSSSKLNFIQNLHANNNEASNTGSTPNSGSSTPTPSPNVANQKPLNGVIKLTNNVESAGKTNSSSISGNESAITIVENGFVSKKSRASSCLEKINEEDSEKLKNVVSGDKSPIQSSSTSVSPLSSNGGSSTPPTMSPPPPPPPPTIPDKNIVKTEKKSEIDEQENGRQSMEEEEQSREHEREERIEKSETINFATIKIKSEPAIVVGDKRKFSSISPPPLIINSRRSPGKLSNHSSRSSSPPSTYNALEKYSRGAPPNEGSRSSPPNSIKSNSSSRVPSPQELAYLRQSSPIHLHHQLSPQQQLMLSQQNHLHARLSAGPTPPSPHQQQHHNNHLLSNHPDSRIMISSPSLMNSELRNLADKSDPLSMVTPTSLSFHHHSLYRINGVRPEVISGGAVTPNAPPSNGSTNGNGSLVNGGTNSSSNSINSIRKSPSISRSPNSSPRSNASSSGGSGSTSTTTHLSNGSLHHSPPNIALLQQQQQNLMSTVTGNLAMMNSMSGPNNNSNNGNGAGHNHVNLNRTPTVIMGEAGGVRTMVWAQPGVPDLGQSPQQGGSSPSTNGHHYNLSSSPLNSHSHLTNGHATPSNSLSPPHLHNSNSNNSSQSISSHLKGGLSMERLWASEALNLSTGANNPSNHSNSNGYGSNSNSNSGHGSNSFSRNNSHGSTNSNNTIPILSAHGNGTGGLSNGHHGTNSSSGIMSSLHPDDEDYEQPMICMICEDRATGLHYGIITCEGCKGFFKRTVQNRRVYTCVADGTCEITKAQRNRCQYCRFKKCIEQGMVLQAVREDRMPGGRNSGAVYNLYKVPVKYRKHKKGNRGAGGAGGKLEKNSPNGGNNIMGSSNSNSSSNGPTPSLVPSPSPQGINGTILKAALTSPNEIKSIKYEINHLRPTSIPFDQATAMIGNLVHCDNFHDIAALQNWEELLEGRGDLSEKLCQMGDSIVYRLVQWTKRLPFYHEVPVDVHTRILTHKWHELLVLTTSAWQAMNTPGPSTNLTIEEEAMENLQILQRCLQAMMGRSLTLEQLRQDVGQMVERLTYLTRSFRRLGIRLEEYVTLKVIAMLQNYGPKSNEVGAIQERYIKCLGSYLETSYPSHTNRLNDLLRTLPEVQTAAALLLESKMFYVPFLLNSALQR